jgi:hypothetical protein
MGIIYDLVVKFRVHVFLYPVLQPVATIVWYEIILIQVLNEFFFHLVPGCLNRMQPGESVFLTKSDSLGAEIYTIYD